MKVYRFERNGYGPYTHNQKVSDKRLTAQIDNHEGYGPDPFDHAYKTWPTSMSDNIPFHYAIGCSSVKALTTWFDGMVGSLVRCGFRIRIYDVPDDMVCVGRSGKQVGFEVGTGKVIR